MRKHYLNNVFEPRSIAVVGASERESSVGGQVLRNIIDSRFKGPIFPVNPRYETVLGLRAYPSIRDIDHPLDLVVITIPAASIAEVMRQCGERDAGAAIVISAGFGFSTVASLGATADVGFGEVLDYLALDSQTRSILLYIEGISDARSFMSGLRVAARLKPAIVVKSGRSESGTRAAVSHTGALVGSDEVFDTAGRCGYRAVFRGEPVRREQVFPLYEPHG